MRLSPASSSWCDYVLLKWMLDTSVGEGNGIYLFGGCTVWGIRMVHTHTGVGIHIYACSQRSKEDTGCLLILLSTLIPLKTGSLTGPEARLMTSNALVSSIGFVGTCMCSRLLLFLGSGIRVLMLARSTLTHGAITSAPGISNLKLSSPDFY